MESPDAAPSPRPRLLRWLRAELVYGLELAALVALALTQPVLDLFGRAPDVFVFEGADGGDVITFAILFSVVPLGLLWALEAGVGVLHSRVRRALHLGLVAVAAALVTVNAVKQLSSVRGPTAVVLASAGALAAGLAYTRTRVVKQFLQVAGAALPLFVALFLLVSPVGALVRPGGGATFDGAQVEETPPVVMLMLDELPLASLLRRDGSIDAELYPNFARLAGIANWYPNATTVSSATWYAVPSLLSGRLPEQDALPLETDWPDNLFTVLSDDYGLEVQEALTGLCPLSRCSRTGSGGGLRAMARRGLRVFADVVSPEDSEADPTATFVEPGADDQPDIDFDAFERFQPDRFNRFVDRIGTAPEPAVHYLHLLLPHTPWRLFPSGREYANPEHLPGNDEGVWAQDGWASLQARQRHLLQTRYVDGLVGELLDRLEATGLLEPSMLIVTSDHGIAFQPGQPLKGNKREDLPPAIAPEMAWVPLFVKTPGQGAGETDDRNALLVDVLPTVADVLGVDLPSS
ncbi:MAG: sulfatase-like hydrolase/transferase, partial [Actinomycetota bacterium]|nr:sulfatase-like hydrolase/transferase [Actinomycetota bacterium]